MLSAKSAKLHLAKFIVAIVPLYIMVSLANTIPNVLTLVAATCYVAGYSDED